jgi:hypothetical protein
MRRFLAPKVNQERIDFLKTKILEIESNLGDEKVKSLITEFREETGKFEYELADFVEYESFQNLDEFARDAATPSPPRIVDVSKEELVWIVERIIEGTTNSNYYLEMLEKNTLDPEVGNLIFCPEQRGFKRTLSPTEIVEIALKYKPIIL